MDAIEAGAEAVSIHAPAIRRDQVKGPVGWEVNRFNPRARD